MTAIIFIALVGQLASNATDSSRNPLPIYMDSSGCEVVIPADRSEGPFIEKEYYGDVGKSERRFFKVFQMNPTAKDKRRFDSGRSLFVYEYVYDYKIAAYIQIGLYEFKSGFQVESLNENPAEKAKRIESKILALKLKKRKTEETLYGLSKDAAVARFQKPLELRVQKLENSLDEIIKEQFDSEFESFYSRKDGFHFNGDFVFPSLSSGEKLKTKEETTQILEAKRIAELTNEKSSDDFLGIDSFFSLDFEKAPDSQTENPLVLINDLPK
ncbi:MAG: hypothetical protein JWQ35_1070 [Bacteriovoracaceae bacterium]|nr:hypothetical protein [Bacteriovoracaceae bacterium]